MDFWSPSATRDMTNDEDHVIALSDNLRKGSGQEILRYVLLT